MKEWAKNPLFCLTMCFLSLMQKDRIFSRNELHGCQVFITCCEKSNKEQLKDGKIFLLNNGEVS